jgi:hypothetical protein
MNIRTGIHIRTGILMAMGALAFASVGDRARAGEVLYDGVGFMQGTQSFTDSFNLPSPGTLTVTLANVAWPEQLASLSFLLTTPSGAVGPEMGPGTSTFNVTAGNVSAQWFGTAQGALNTGVYSMEIQFQPTTGGSGSPVPLPTSIALFLSGLGLLIWQRRTRTESSRSLNRSRDMQAT